MQIVMRKSENVHFLLDMVDIAYLVTSVERGRGLLPYTFDESFEDLFEIFEVYGDMKYSVDFVDAKPEQMNIKSNKKDIILAFTGGKDSIASAIKYRDAGYNVHLYHMKHVNRSLSDECEVAERCAKILDMPIFFDDIAFRGQHMWMEHPMKNMIIANGALSYGVREGIGTKIAFGNYTTSLLVDNPFDRCAGDCIDMWDAYNAIISRFIPNFEVLVNLENVNETLKIVTSNRELLDNSLSCLCRHSLRAYRHRWVKDKFGVELPKYRCGSCYKCCMEYVYMADHDLIDFNENYYRYCLNQLTKVLKAEEGVKLPLDVVWNHFFMYPSTVSKSVEVRDACR